MTASKYVIEDRHIKALRDIPLHGITAGDRGGFVTGYRNLSQQGECWIEPHASVVGEAHVGGDAYVGGSARVSGFATISETSRVIDSASVSDHAHIKGAAEVSSAAHVAGYTTIEGQARISGHARVLGEAVVRDDATVNGHALVSGSAVIKDSATVRGNSRILDFARIEQSSDVFGYASVFERAVVRGSAFLSGHARVGGHSIVQAYMSDRSSASEYAQVTGGSLLGVARVLGHAISHRDYFEGVAKGFSVCDGDVAWDEKYKSACNVSTLPEWVEEAHQRLLDANVLSVAYTLDGRMVLDMHPHFLVSDALQFLVEKFHVPESRIDVIEGNTLPSSPRLFLISTSDVERALSAK